MMASGTRAIAFDFGGSHVSVAIMSDNSLLAMREIEVKATEGLAPILPLIEKAVSELLSAVALRFDDCLGVSMSLPSIVDFEGARVLSANDKYSDAPSIDLPAWSQTTFGLPLVLENDARASLMGEHAYGAARGFSDVLMLTFGTGIGSAVLVGGKPYRTSQAQGGNLGGHIPVSLYGRACTCGATGCMEAEASTWSLPLIVKEWPRIGGSSLRQQAIINFKMLFENVAKGDEVAKEIAGHCIQVWGAGIVGLIHCYGPEVVVLGGGVMQNETEIIPQIREYVNRHAWTPSGAVTIKAAELGNQAALYAAVPLLRAKLHAL
jgi:glucokinase